jgi:ribosome-associated protein
VDARRSALTRPRDWTSAVERDVPIRGEMIRLGQLLKLAGVADAGADAKRLLAEGAVTVNGEPEIRRGRQLHGGDVVQAEGETLRVVV